MKINTLAEVISCTGTLTLLDVWRQGVTGQKVGEAAAKQGGFEITNFTKYPFLYILQHHVKKAAAFTIKY